MTTKLKKMAGSMAMVKVKVGPGAVSDCTYVPFLAILQVRTFCRTNIHIEKKKRHFDSELTPAMK